MGWALEAPILQVGTGLADADISSFGLVWPGVEVHRPSTKQINLHEGAM
jgi:hypothetical protein